MKYKTFFATDDQVQKMCVNVIMSSTHDTDLSIADLTPIIEVRPDDIILDALGITIIYDQGRMVNIEFVRQTFLKQLWWVSFGGCIEPRIQYQSWCWKYPTFEELALSVSVICEDGPSET